MRYVASGIVAILLGLSFSAGLFSGLEQFFEDIFFSAKPISREIVIVAIDDTSIAKIGQWPWPRAVFAQLFEKLGDHPPKSVGLDVLLSEPSRLGADDDRALESALLRLSYPVVLPVQAAEVSLFGGPSSKAGLIRTERSFLRNAALVSTGHVNLVLSADGVARRVPLVIAHTDEAETGEERIVALPLRVVGPSLAESERLERIVFAGPPGSFRTISFSRVLDEDIDLSDTYVFVGATAPSLHDEKPTPFSRGTQMSGVEIQANIANMLLNGYRLRDIPFAIQLAWIAFAAFLPRFLFDWVQKMRRTLVLSVFAGCAYLVASIILFQFGYVVNVVHITLGWVFGTAAAFLYQYISVEKSRREMRRAFSKYVSRDILDEILRDPSKVQLGGEEKDATIFFSDVRGFTSFSEKLTPRELTAFLNRYLTVMTDIALSRNGVLDKYIGDAIMAFWGAPLTNSNHAKEAVETALAMIDALSAFNTESAEKGDLMIDIGIGLNSGRVVAGNMGSHQRFDYTVMGDAVNLASRLEGQTKTYGVHIIASEFTVQSLRDLGVADQFLLREIDRIKVKGKAQPVVIFEVVERARAVFVRSILEAFSRCRELYYVGEWRECATIAKQILSLGDDGPTKVLAERCAYFLEHPPLDWQGVYEFKTK